MTNQNVNNSVLPSDSSEETEALFQALHHRLVTTGEWHKLSNQLEQLLQDSNWTSQMTEVASNKAKEMEELNVDEIVKTIMDEGQKTIPKNVENEMMKQIKDFLNRNVEDA
ncbi:unnamed protein product [Sympodiomycopsis kandeliae]